MRLWGFAGIAAAAWLLAGISASPARAADDPALPPLSGPPMDVPMHEPKPPRDIEGPAPRPPSPPTTTALPIPPPQRQLSPSAAAAASPALPQRHPAPSAAAALPAPPPPRPLPNRPIIAASSAPTPGVISPRPPIGTTVTPRICRGEAKYTVTIDGRPQIAVARVCQQDDGSWRLSP
ncbi:MAG TPA: hypothetical protein VGB82_19055 [Alphaproteobacteria bacterium]